MNYKSGIDFIIVIFYRFGYAQLLVESIKKYVKDIPYTIHITNNGINEGENSGYDILKDMFKDESSVKVHKGVEQGIDSNEEHYNDYICKIDGRGVAIGSWAQTEAMNIGVREGDRKYICYLDADAIFLNEWVGDILPMLGDKFFVTHAWRNDIDISVSQFTIFKRKNIVDNYLYEKDDLYPNIHYKDVTGTLSLYCQEKNLSYVVLKNSFNDHSLKSQHLLNLKNGEQTWINDVPFFYHYGRGSVRKDDLYMDWMRESAKYLNLKIKDITL
ncbi:hypothetical protein CMI47_09815 [Candidatus Pacearchaeota archaeon]|nr:hypothetical protein [Candidatus Pacearchaeota archaeon]